MLKREISWSLFTGGRRRSVGIILISAVIIIIANLDAVIDSIYHPKILYFDPEHLIVGGISAAIVAVLLTIQSFYTANLRSSEERLRQIVEQAPYPIEVCSPDGTATLVNKAFLNMFGIPSSDLVVGRYNVFSDPVVRDLGLLDDIKKVYKGESVFVPEIVVPMKQIGKEYRVEKEGVVVQEAAMFPVFQSSGEIWKVVTIWKDITGRKRAEEALRRAEEKYRAIIEHSNDLIWTLDKQGNFTYINKRSEEISGYRLADWLGRSFEPLIPTEDLPRIKEIFSATISGKPMQYEARVKRKDGSLFVLSVTTTPLYDSGEVVGTVNFGRDISERQRAEKALQEGEKRYKRLVESVTDYIYTVKVENGRPVATSHGPGCVAVTGYTSEEYAADPYLWHRMVHEGDREAVTEQAAKILSGVSTPPLEHRIIHKDGSIRWVRNTPVPRYDENRRLVAYDGMITDVTELKQLETQLRQAQKMEAVGQLAGGIAHDFNNILSVIIGYANLLQMKINEDDQSRTYLEQILSTSEKAAHLTHGILAFSRKQVINPRPVDINEIIKRVEKLLLRLIGEDIELKTILNDSGIILMADSSQIEQALINLCTNARDAMQDGGRLVIETDKVELDEKFVKAHAYGKPGTYAVIAVADTGIGMNERTKEKIFDPFFTTKEVGKGTGLGLSIVYGIVKQHDGYINCYSEPGRGTTFKIYLPVIKSKIDAAESAAFSPTAGGTETVLLVEDDATVSKITKEVLEKFGYKVIVAVDGEDAIKRFLENKDAVRLLILDVIMPRKNGKEAYEEIKKIQPDIKVIFTSGYTADIIHKKGIFEERINFMPKPILPSELLKKVRHVLDA